MLAPAVPPELLVERKLTTASDVYAFGVLLFELWCCRQAWEGLSHTQVLAAVTVDRRRLPFPDNAPPDIVVPPPRRTLHASEQMLYCSPVFFPGDPVHTRYMHAAMLYMR